MLNGQIGRISMAMAVLLAGFGYSAAQAQCVATADGSGVLCFTLLAGQTIDAGSVCVELDGSNLLVTYQTTGGWELIETHLWVGISLADLPMTKKGNPIPGQFPYVSGDITGQTSYTFTVPVSITCPGDDQMYYMAAHAALQKVNGDGGYQTETGWSDGDRFTDKGNWGTFSTFTLTCDCDTPPPPPMQCETAFAAGDVCFLDLDLNSDGKGDFNRWGWTNGPLSEGSYAFDIYAGAGQCDIEKGTHVGTLSVVYGNGIATVTFDMFAGYAMNETHLYVGNDILPKDKGEYTVAPGQYPDIHEELGGASSDSYTVEGLSGDIYVVAHAVVCW